jgi:hypothetical protein
MRAIALVKPIDWPYVLRRTTGIHLPAGIAALAVAAAIRTNGMRTKPVAMSGVDVFNLETFDSRIGDL